MNVNGTGSGSGSSRPRLFPGTDPEVADHQPLTPPPLFRDDGDRHQISRAGDLSQGTAEVGQSLPGDAQVFAQALGLGPGMLMGHRVEASRAGRLVGGQDRVPTGQKRAQGAIEDGDGKRTETDVAGVAAWGHLGAVAAQDVSGGGEQAVEGVHRLAQHSFVGAEFDHRHPSDQLNVELPGRLALGVHWLPDSADLSDHRNRELDGELLRLRALRAAHDPP
ncbi:hypothetical protein GCM10009738_19210 [Kitasatospora viridis]